MHTWYITASLFHWNIKVYIFITILERKDQVKKRTCGLSGSSFLTVRRKRKDLDSRTGRPQWRVAIDLCTYEEGRQTVALEFTHICIHTQAHTGPSSHLHSSNPALSVTLWPSVKRAPESSAGRGVLAFPFSWPASEPAQMFLEGVVVEIKVQRKAKNKDYVHRQTLHLENNIDIYEHAATSIVPANFFKKFSIKYYQNFVKIWNRSSLVSCLCCTILIS